MRRRLVELSLAALVAPALPAGAMPLGTSARQSPSGSLKLLAYYQGVSEQAVDFNVAGSGSCTSASGAVSFACGQSGNVEAKGDGSAGMLKLALQLGDYVQPYAIFGSGSYELSVPSTTLVNELTGQSGLLYGGGVKVSVVPETLVDTAIALDLGYARSSYDFTRIAPGGAPNSGPLDQTLTLDTFQLAVEASRSFALKGGSRVEPYGGVKMMRVEADLKDHPSGGHAGGKTDTASPFLGLRWAGERLAGFVESSFVGGYHHGAGVECRFR